LVRIGADDPSFKTIVGDGTFTAYKNGELQFRIHDADACLADNDGLVAGTVTVGVKVDPPGSVAQRILLYVYDPIMPNGMRLHAAYGWQDPVSLTNQIVSDLQADSHGVVRFNIVDTQVVNQFPVFQDGFQYTATSWDYDWTHHQPHQSGFDYKRFIDGNNIVARVESGDIDEVWLYADPMASMWESTMAGAGAYWCNSPPVSGVSSTRAFVLMGWNYERGVGEAIHSYGHRVESIMTHIYGSWPKDQSNNWGRFTLLDKDAPGLGGVGNVHFPVNGLSDYDYANSRYVLSNADDWYNYPYFTGATKSINYTTWSPTRADPQRDYLNWWYAHIPHFGGRGPDGFLNDWWRYIVDVDTFKGSIR
jgi:hypothetical protein